VGKGFSPRLPHYVEVSLDDGVYEENRKELDRERCLMKDLRLVLSNNKKITV